MTANKFNYERLAYLGTVIRNNKATKAEKDEYMLLMYQSGQITQEQYNSYKSDSNTEDIVKAALAIGAVFLLGYILSDIFSRK